MDKLNTKDSRNKEVQEMIDDVKARVPVAKYGIKFLDDFLGGIYREDLTIITAMTGAGKTEFAYNIAFNHAWDKNVLLFALEADAKEPVRRFYYKIVADLYYKERKKNPYMAESMEKLDMSYANFVNNIIDLSAFEEEAKEIYSSKHKPKIVYYESNFDINEFKKQLYNDGKEYDLIILDHLDYFDIDNNVTENSHMSNLMKELRNVNMTQGTPIIAVSHLRKGMRSTLMPTMDDLMGSSNKSKLAKTIITLAKAKDGYYNGTQQTYISVQKNRIGSTGNIIASHTFDTRTNKYDDDYLLHIYNGYEDSVTGLDKHDYPSWTKKRKPEQKGIPLKVVET